MYASPLRTGLCLLAADSAAFLFSLLISWSLRSLFPGELLLISYLDLLFILPVLWVVFTAQKLYPAALYPPQEEFAKLTCQTSLVFMATWTLLFFSRSALYSRLVFFGLWLLCLALIPFFRRMTRRFFAARPWWGHDAVICGEPEAAKNLYTHLKNEPGTGLKPIALCSLNEQPDADADVPRCSFEDLLEMGSRPNHPYALLAIDNINEQNQKIVKQLSRHFVKTLFVFSFLGPLHLWVTSTDLKGYIALETHQKLLDRDRQRIKRCIDLILSLAVLIPALLMGLPLAALIKLEDKGPVFYRQNRIGRHGKSIRILKFRTMVPQAEKILADHLREHPELAKEWKAKQKLEYDPRITKIGAIIRRASLDELPQLWNVLTGELSLVGPRPIVESEIPRYGEAYELYSQVRPGLTGLWQVSGRSRLSYEKRVALDTYYIRNWSIWFDIYILAKTPGALLQTQNAM